MSPYKYMDRIPALALSRPTRSPSIPSPSVCQPEGRTRALDPFTLLNVPMEHLASDDDDEAYSQCKGGGVAGGGSHGAVHLNDLLSKVWGIVASTD